MPNEQFSTSSSQQVMSDSSKASNSKTSYTTNTANLNSSTKVNDSAGAFHHKYARKIKG